MPKNEYNLVVRLHIGRVAKWFKATVLKTVALRGLVGSNPTPSASWENANLQRLPRPANGGTWLEFERAFLTKKKRIYQEGQKKFS